jgi:leucyl-tRNA synthetase
MYRFLDRVCRLVIADDGGLTPRVRDIAPSDELARRLHRTIDKVTDDLDHMRFNTAIAALIELNNALWKEDAVPRSVAECLALLLSPFAPHLGEELWQALGHEATLAYHPWPVADPALLVEDSWEIPVQVNGRLRATLTVPQSCTTAEILALAKADPNVAAHLAGQTLIKEIYVPGKIVNLVVRK